MTQKSPGDGLFPKPTIVGPGGTVDSLPDDDETATKFRTLAVFRASIRQSRITVAGDLILALSVPYEWKYAAMPMTDIRGVQFLIQVLEPVMGGEDEVDEGSTVGAGAMADVLHITEWLTSDDPVSPNGQE